MRLLIVVFASFVFLQPQSPALGPWLFGMTKAEVTKFQRFGPYKEVRSTGGVETANGLFNDKKTNISFIFDDKGLSRIQVWAYEGRSLDEATDAWKALYLYLQRSYGTVEVPQIRVDPKSDPLTPETLSIAVKVHVDALGKVQMAPKKMPGNAVVFSSFMKQQIQGSPYYYVFLYLNRP